MLKIIIAQFPSKCHASKKRLKKGDNNLNSFKQLLKNKNYL